MRHVLIAPFIGQTIISLSLLMRGDTMILFRKERGDHAADSERRGDGL
jgi:hypothetical protein